MNSCRVLILDEDCYIRMHYLSLITLLPKSNIVSSKQEVINKLSNDNFQVIIYSCENNFADISHFLENLLTFSIKIILLWDKNDPAVLLHFLSHGVFACPNKQINSTELSELVQCACDTYDHKDELQLISCKIDWIEWIIPSQSYYIPRISNWIHRFLFRLSNKDAVKLMYAFRELLQNALEHGNHYLPDKKILVRYNLGHNCIIFFIQDEGNGFDLSSLPHALVGKTKKKTMEVMMYRKRKGMRPGGLGIASIFSIADEVIYNQTGNGVLIIKYLPSQHDIEQLYNL